MVETYLDSQVEKLDQLIEGISHETFWQVFPKILGIDAKLTLLTELMPFEDFSNEETSGLLRMIIEIILKSCVGTT